MKRIAVFILTFCIVFSCFTNTFCVSAEQDFSESWETCKSLGLINYTDDLKDESITRAEFADALVKAMKLNTADAAADDRQASGFKDDENLFADVASVDEYYGSIKTICDYGIMNGDADGNFYPNKGIKYEEAIKTFISLLGYDTEALIKGGWFVGYSMIAQKLKISVPGVNDGKVLSKAEFTEMLFRAFHVEVKEINKISKGSIYYESDNDKTFLSEILNIGFAEGQVTQVENTSLTSKLSSVASSITVDGVTIENPNKINTNKYLGRIAKAYYDISGKKDKLMYITYSDKDEVINIRAKDFDGYGNGVLTYYDGNRKRSVNISSYPVIYNGVAMPTYSDDIFDIEYGSITVTKNNDENVVIIYEYKDMVITSISDSEKVIYGKYTDNSVSLDDSEYLVYITDASGEQIPFEDIKYGMSASVIDGENYKEFHLYDLSVKGTLESYDKTDRKITVSGKEYGVSEAAAEKINSAALRTDVKIYINTFGDVFYMTSVSKSAMSGVLAAVDTESMTQRVKIFGDDGNFHIYDIDRNAKIYTASSTSAVKLKDDIDGASGLNGYRGYIIYKLSGEKLKEIQIPLESRTLKQDGDGRTTLKTVEIGAVNFWNYDVKSIGNDVFFDASVKLYSVPNDPHDYDDYQLIDYNNITPYEMFSGQIKAYYDDFDDPIPEAAVVKNFKVENAHIRIMSNMSVIKEITTGIDENGDTVKRAVIVNANNEESEVFSREVAVDSSGESCTLFDAASNFVDGEKVALDVGDIIIYNTKYSTNELTKVRVIYDCDKANMPGGKKGYLSASVTGTDMYYALNSSYNILRDWDPYKYHTVSDMVSGSYITGTVLTRQNPIRISSGTVSGNNVIERLGTNAHASFNGGYKIMLGYVVDNTDAFVYLTTQDLSVPGAVYAEDGMPDVQIPNPSVDTPDNYTGYYHQEYYRYVNSYGYILLVEYYDRGINIRKATPSDILSYKEAGGEASRILAFPDQYRYFIINDYRNR